MLQTCGPAPSKQWQTLPSAGSLTGSQPTTRPGGLLHYSFESCALLPGGVSLRLDIKKLSQLSLASSILPALLLAVQPLSAAHPCTTSSTTIWQAPLRDMFSFTVLLGVFIVSEPAAAAASAVSAAGGALALVCQHMALPTAATVTATLLTAAAVCTLAATCITHARGRTSAGQQQGQQGQQGQPTGVTPRRRCMPPSLVTSCPHSLQTLSAEGLATSSTAASSAASLGSSSVQHHTPHAGGHSTATAARGTGPSPDPHSKGRGGPASRDQPDQDEQQQHPALLGLQQVLGVLGGGLLLQFAWSLARDQSVAQTGAAWLLPVAAGASAVLVAGRIMRWRWPGSKQLQQLEADWPAWSATLLLILQPLHQLVDLALHPADAIPEASAGQLVLLLLANGLMVPRAVLTKQFMWFTGTCSGALLAAGQLVLMGLHGLTTSLQLLALPVLLQTSGASAAAGSTGSGGSWCAPFGVLMQWHSSSDPSLAAFTPGRPGLLVVVLAAWMWLSVALLQLGWRHIQSPLHASHV